MSNSTYKPQGFPSNLIGTGGVTPIPAAGSADAQLLQQQTLYWGLCDSYVSSASAPRQTALLIVQNSTYMTAAQANAYFPGTTAAYWSYNIIDYFAALAAMRNSGF
jgi:hypothetical protein